MVQWQLQLSCHGENKSINGNERSWMALVEGILVGTLTGAHCRIIFFFSHRGGCRMNHLASSSPPPPPAY
ncbi:hypothetical protein K457DRAFT_1599971 [Linnemannia elongata AG-77]|uniref:Uncharacterized protein n=1 Tax=Linnemannia elongata AG-77 TaxID=1314771 RepID=A0A197JN88_9FUNG|nr:hypothetical protein K457DRAFT_1599971 [Linnemannia elongata AG-77]